MEVSILCVVIGFLYFLAFVDVICYLKPELKGNDVFHHDRDTQRLTPSTGLKFVN